MDDLYWLEQIQPQHRDWVGDKAFYLALLKQRGYPVGAGVVVSASQLQAFITSLDWQEQLFTDLPHSSLYLDTDNPRQLQSLAQEMQQTLLAAKLPALLLDRLAAAIQPWQTAAVIFRPSLALLPDLDPTVSARTTGLLTSRIWQPGSPPERQDLGQHLKAVWAEFFSAKSLFYWQRFGVQLQQVRLAVLVQPIRSSRAAGQLQLRSGQVQIEASWGLGQTLSLGAVDRFCGDLEQGTWSEQIGQKQYAYRVAPLPQPERGGSLSQQSLLTAWIPEPESGLELELIPSPQQTQPTLSPDQLQHLTTLAQQIQTGIGLPLRLEWTLETDDTVQITQALPQFGADWLHLASNASASNASASNANVPDTPTPDASPQSGPAGRGDLSPALDSTPVAQVLTGLAAAPGRAVAPAWVLDSKTIGSLDEIPSGVILVASVLTPQMVQIRQLAGIVTEQGGMTSHAAILARELEIPAVVGVGQATQIIRTGDPTAVDGEQGQVYCGLLELPPRWQELGQDSGPTVSPEPLRRPERPTQLWVSLSQLNTLSQVASLPVDGLGLLRSELMLLDLFGQQHPLVWLRQGDTAAVAAQIAARVLPFASAFAPRPVFYRAMDLRAHEFTDAGLGHLAIPESEHAMLGVRGSFSFQIHPDSFRVQLLALKQLQQQGITNLSLLLPFVRTVEEFRFCREQVEQAGLLESPEFQLWIMAEVPSVLLLLPDYAAAGVQGIAIGMNDLTQLLLGVDRDQPQMAKAFDPSHPAVLRAVQQLIQTANQLHLPCSVCGQSFQQQPQLLVQLVDWGVTAISVEPREVEGVRRLLGDGEMRK